MHINIDQNILVLITTIKNLTTYNHKTQKQLFNLTNEHITNYWIHRDKEKQRQVGKTYGALKLYEIGRNDSLPFMKNKTNRDNGDGHNGCSLSLVPIDQSTDAL